MNLKVEVCLSNAAVIARCRTISFLPILAEVRDARPSESESKSDKNDFQAMGGNWLDFVVNNWWRHHDKRGHEDHHQAHTKTGLDRNAPKYGKANGVDDPANG